MNILFIFTFNKRKQLGLKYYKINARAVKLTLD